MSEKSTVVDTDLKRFQRQKEFEEQDLNEKEKNEKQRRNSNFVMMYRDHMPEMRWLMKKNGTSAGILNFIMEHMDYNNALICSNAILMDYFHISASTIKRAIKLLKDSGFIDVLKSGTTNIYVVNMEIAWTSYDNQKNMCKFDGKILISAKENKDYEYINQNDKFKALRLREGIEA